MVCGKMDTETGTSAPGRLAVAELCRQPGQGGDVFYQLALDE